MGNLVVEILDNAVKGNEITIHTNSTIKSVLLDHPGCIYSTMYVSVDKASVTDLESHVDRVSQSTMSTDLENTRFRSRIRSRIQEALQSSTLSKHVFGEATDLMMVVVISQKAQAKDAMKIFMSQYGGVQHGGTAYIIGPPRKNPTVKDTTWVAERRYLEEMAPPGAAEVLLCTEQGCLLEGLLTNLFIVIEKESGEKVVQTAPVEAGVLAGTMRARVLEACEFAGIPVEHSVCPHVSQRHAWREAFLTNSLRKIQALGGITCQSNNVWGLAPWCQTLPLPVPGPVSTILSTSLDQILSKCS